MRTILSIGMALLLASCSSLSYLDTYRVGYDIGVEIRETSVDSLTGEELVDVELARFKIGLEDGIAGVDRVGE